MNNKDKKIQNIANRISPKVLLLTLAAAALLGACGGGKEGQAAGTQAAEGPSAKALAVPPGWVGRKPPSAIAQKIAELEASGALPKLDTSNSIAGPDVNGNGIRDDIDAYISSNALDAERRAAVERIAMAMQKALVVDKSNLPALKTTLIEMSTSAKCIFEVFRRLDASESSVDAAGDYISKIEQLTANTKPRLTAYLDYSKAISGGLGVERRSCE